MNSQLVVTEYYELLVLHRAIWAARYTDNPLLPEALASPFLADIAKRTIDTLIQLSMEKGDTRQAEGWRIRVNPTGDLWKVIVQRQSEYSDFWRKATMSQKREIAQICLTPMIFDDEIIDRFVEDVDSAVNSSV